MGYINTMRSKFKWAMIILIIFAMSLYLFRRVAGKSFKNKKTKPDIEVRE